MDFATRATGFSSRLPNILPFDISCRMPFLTQSIINSLQPQGFEFNTTASIRLVIDIPQGYAFSVLSSVQMQGLRLVVLTFNQCGEYIEDIWDLQPDILLVNPKATHDITNAVRHAASGENYRIAPAYRTPLTRTERRVLHYIAQGWSNNDIAGCLAIQETTVMNTTTKLFKKLNLDNRTHAALYYWGLEPCSACNEIHSSPP